MSPQHGCSGRGNIAGQPVAPSRYMIMAVAVCRATRTIFVAGGRYAGRASKRKGYQESP